MEWDTALGSGAQGNNEASGFWGYATVLLVHAKHTLWPNQVGLSFWLIMFVLCLDTLLAIYQGPFQTVFKNQYEWKTEQQKYSRGRTTEKKKKKGNQKSADLWVVPILVSFAFAYYIIVQTTIAGGISSAAIFPFLVIQALNIFWAAPWKQREWIFLMNFTCNGCIYYMDDTWAKLRKDGIIWMGLVRKQ